MLVIRLLRVGKKNQPAFKIVVTDKKKSATKGVYVEEVGFCNPLTKEKVLKQERIKYWLSVGAKPSATVHNLLISEKIVEGKKTPVHKKKKVKEGSETEEKPVETAAPAPEVKPEPEKPLKEDKSSSPPSSPEEVLKEDKSSSPPSSPEEVLEEDKKEEKEKAVEEEPQIEASSETPLEEDKK